MDPYAAAQTQTYQPTPTPSSTTTSSSQIQSDPYIYSQQSYDPSQYAAYYQQYDQSQQQQPQAYDQTYYQAVQPEQQQQEHVPIHPPGVPVQPDPNQYTEPYYQTDPNAAYYQTDPNAAYYYAQPQTQPQPPQVQPQVAQQQPASYSESGVVVPPGQQPWQHYQAQAGDYGLASVYPPLNEQGSQYGGPSRGGGRGFRGGASSIRGRGRGTSGGRGSAPGRGSGGRVSGGRGFAGRVGGRGGRASISQPKPQPKPQFLAWCELCRVDCNTHEVLENHKNGKKHKKNMEIQEELKKLAAGQTLETQTFDAPTAPSEIPEVKADETQVGQSEEAENSLKRKMIDEERNSAEPVKKPREKEPVPFICELCDVKCESAPVFDCHLKGRKHSFNLQRFQEQQLGQVALQALYPALEAALYPVLLQALAQSASTSYAYGGLDQQVLQLLQPYLPQTGPGYYPRGPESAHGPRLEPYGPPRGASLETGDDHMKPLNEPESKTEDQTESVIKTEDQVEPDMKTEDQVEPDMKTEDQVEPDMKTEDQVEPDMKTEDQVEPDMKTEDQIEPDMKTEDQVEPEIKIEDQMEPESKTGDQMEPGSKTEEQMEPESKTEDQMEPEPETKTEQIDPNAAEPN